MYAIKNVSIGKFAKHTGETVNNEGYQYVEYPWKLVKNIEDAQQYTTLEHANEIAFWHLDNSEKWVVVNVWNKEEHKVKTGKYFV